MSERYNVQYAHRLCHPETCAHRDDWQLWDGNCCIEYFSTKEEAQAEADRLNNGGAVDPKDDEITALRQQLEQAEARVAELEYALSYLREPWDLGQLLGAETRRRVEFADSALAGNKAGAWLLRKQAEAVAAVVGVSEISASLHAQRLRDQADQIEAEQAGGSDV